MENFINQMISKVSEMKDYKAKGICPICKAVPGPFKDELSKKEFKISGMCQECQDEFFT